MSKTLKDIDNVIDEVLQDIEETKKRKLMHTVVFYWIHTALENF